MAERSAGTREIVEDEKSEPSKCLSKQGVNVLVHVIFLLVILGSADFVFGLHFYYDLPLVSTMLAALDMGVFPYFLATRHKDMERKRK
uniref:DUF4305 domain-containing protein n=1 Tax=Angiostrongylus cantonensis TaxID=6313 RepID=A0A0K0D0F8_ANGCA